MKNFHHCIVLCLALLLTGNLSYGQSQRERADKSASGAIQAILDSISSSNIHSYLDTLVGFYTRHTVSDTTSDSVGIGAARRWHQRRESGKCRRDCCQTHWSKACCRCCRICARRRRSCRPQTTRPGKCRARRRRRGQRHKGRSSASSCP